MFENPFKKSITTATAATGHPEPTPQAASDAARLHSGVPAEETQAWQDKIHGAASDDAALLQLAQQAPTVPLKLLAIEALTQEESFRQAMHEFREQDKRLYRAAKSRWETASGRRAAAAAARDLIASARAFLDQEAVPVNRIVDLDRAWAALNAELLDADLAAEFAALSTALGSKVRERGERTRSLSRWLSAVDIAIEKLSATLPSVAQADIAPAESEALAVSLLELLGTSPDPGAARSIEKMDAANRLLALASTVVQRALFLQTLPAAEAIDEAREKLLIEQWRAFPDLPEGDKNELHTVLAHRFANWRNASTLERQREHDAHRSQERERHAEHNQQHGLAIQSDVEAAEAAQAGGHVADLARLLAAIEHALKRGAVNAALAQRIEALRREHRRLQDWQRWSGRQGREQLAAEAQELARISNGKVAVKAHAEAIDKLRERWKELDKLGGASNQSVWLVFDGALKTAYAPVATHLEKLKAERIENLAKREQIVDALVLVAAKFFPAEQAAVTPAPAPAAQPDWRAIAHALEDAQVAWRKLGPVEHTVPRKALKGDHAVTTRYAAAVLALQAPLQNAYADARRQREQLIAAARDLGATADTARDVVDNVRKLQTQWQGVAKGVPLPRRDENALWAAFKTATDAIFAARDTARAASEAEFNAKQKARAEIIERVAALARATTAADIRRALSEADAAWRAAPDAPKPQAAKLEARYRAARDAASKRISELALHAEQARYDALLAKIALCEEREGAQDAGGAITEELAANLQASWNAIEHFPEAWKAKLEARFQGNGISPAVSIAAPASKSGRHVDEGLPGILLNLEVACGIDSPGEFLAARQQLKIRALKNAMEARQTTVTTPADIERWLLDAAAYPRPDGMSRERLAKIIAAVRRRRPA